ncbi:cAMP-dependent protein kinase catalytic subunit beta-like [Ischnura elegans]|uniref:cAMP-dependent protein kinase catalytic subunit beta-like n=1 Tax=Ischnura elegans TaxID=197161 RepID=UPI001ED8B2BE|nr:cAMP-dependent protein kinase catalytic subunit beta-like [Ischnura elegans]
MEPIKDWNFFLQNSRRDFDATLHQKFPTNISVKDFEFRRTLGTGSFGRVKLVKWLKNDKYYAMKILEKGKVVKARQLEHTLNEKKILQSIKFPFIVHMEFGFMNNDYVFFVMPFVCGGELFSHIRRFGKFEESQTKFYAGQAILALEYLHYLDIVYRDLKPENILITENGYLKLTDLGFCKRISGRTWTLCGTPEYLAPEVILSKGYGKSVDWWSMGVLIFEMSSGRAPFTASDPMKIYEKIVAGKYKMESYFSPDLRDLLRHLLQTDLTRRFGNLKKGVNDIKEHRFFQTLDWIGLVNQKIAAPFIPRIKGEGDPGNFEVYPEEPIKESPVEQYPKEFSEF